MVPRAGPEANLRPNSRRSYENAIVRLNRIAGARRINSLGHEDMAAIQDGLKCYSPKTATITWSVLKNALEAARDETSYGGTRPRWSAR